MRQSKMSASLLSPPILSPIAPKKLEPIIEDEMFVGNESPAHITKS